jgi:HTH-type transcriptional regulator, transcriptional repressor of NAD biosynthesis genes
MTNLKQLPASTSKEFKRGFVVGKFAPLHKGHQYVIDTALERCDHVFVLSYTSEEFFGCDSTTRQYWLETIYKNEIDDGRLEVLVLNPDIESIPLDDAPAYMHREFCRIKILTRFPEGVDAVFASESYGLLLAGTISPECQFCMVDEDRELNKVSGTMLRDMIANDYRDIEDWVDPEVFATFIPRILILGGESSGKTTIIHHATDTFDWVPVYEYGRALWEQTGGKLTFKSMQNIAEVQRQQEYFAGQRAYDTNKEFVICDTCSITTSIYSEALFGRVGHILRSYTFQDMYRYKYIFICDPNIPFDQDGTRRDEKFRDDVHQYYCDVLRDFGLGYTIISGTVEERLEQIKMKIL